MNKIGLHQLTFPPGLCYGSLDAKGFCYETRWFWAKYVSGMLLETVKWWRREGKCPPSGRAYIPLDVKMSTACVRARPGTDAMLAGAPARRVWNGAPLTDVVKFPKGDPTDQPRRGGRPW